jgi:shikimate dehydrogenase
MVFTFQDFILSDHSSNPHYLVIGHPISHSLSPLMHQTALDFHGIDANYVAVDLQTNEISDFISWCNRDQFLGCNITIPYKNTFLEVVDWFDPVAEKMQTINTIVKENHSLKGYNTDVYGFLKGLEPYMDAMDLTRAIIFGTGGAARAVKTALFDAGFEELIFVSRNVSGIESLFDENNINIVNYEQWHAYAEDASLIVNTTPVGMHPKTAKMPISESEINLLKDKICYDLIYNPLETQFLKHAKKAGAVTLNGLDMLIYQGSKSFELWTGKTFPIEQIKKKLNDYFLNH